MIPKPGITHSWRLSLVEYTMLPDGQHPTVAFNLRAQLCGPQVNEMGMGTALFAKNGKGRTSEFCIDSRYPLRLDSNH